AAAVRRGEQLDALLGATRSMMTVHDEAGVLGRIVDEAARIAGTPHVTILLVDQAAGVLRVGAVRGGQVPASFTIPLGQSHSGTVATTGRPLFVADTAADPANRLAARDREAGIRTYLGLPVKVQEEVLGVLTFNTTEPHEYPSDALAYLISFADQAALAIRSVRLRYESERRRRRAAGPA